MNKENVIVLTGISKDNVFKYNLNEDSIYTEYESYKKMIEVIEDAHKNDPQLLLLIKDIILKEHFGYEVVCGIKGFDNYRVVKIDRVKYRRFGLNWKNVSLYNIVETNPENFGSLIIEESSFMDDIIGLNSSAEKYDNALSYGIFDENKEIIFSGWETGNINKVYFTIKEYTANNHVNFVYNLNGDCLSKTTDYNFIGQYSTNGYAIALKKAINDLPDNTIYHRMDHKTEVFILNRLAEPVSKFSELVDHVRDKYDDLKPYFDGFGSKYIPTKIPNKIILTDERDGSFFIDYDTADSIVIMIGGCPNDNISK